MEAEPAEETTETDTDTDEGESEQEAEEVILAPASWGKDDREVWDTLDEGAKAVIARREEERDKAIRAAQSEAGPMKAVVEEYKGYFQQVGVEPDRAFRALVESERSLRFGTPEQKAQALQKIAHDYGIALPQAAQTEDDDLAVDPALRRIEQTIDERFGQLESKFRETEDATQKAAEDEANAMAADFFGWAESADPTEVPEIRYLGDVLPQFQSMVSEARQNGERLSVPRLQELYSNAAWAIPSVRQAMQGDIAEREKAQKARIKKTFVKKSSSASTGSGSGVHFENQPEDETVNQTLQRSIQELSRGRGRLSA